MSTKKKIQLTAVGVDDGFFNTKYYWGRGQSLIIPSRGRLGGAKRISFMPSTSSQSPVEYKTNNQVYTVGASESDSIIHDAYPTSDLNRVIIHHGLRLADFAGKNIAVRTGLPLKKYYLTSQACRNEKLIIKKEGNLKQQVFVNNATNERTANIKLHNVGPEAASVLYDYVIEEKTGVRGGFIEHKDRLKETIAIIDIGGKTTDMCIMEAGDIVLDSIETIDAGMHNIYSNLRDFARDRLSMDRIPDKIIDLMFDEHKLRVGGKEMDVFDLVAESKAMVASDIFQSVSQRIGSKAGMIDKVLYVGGGAEVLGTDIRGRFDNEFEVENPVIANARSLFKALKCGILPDYQG